MKISTLDGATRPPKLVGIWINTGCHLRGWSIKSKRQLVESLEKALHQQLAFFVEILNSTYKLLRS